PLRPIVPPQKLCPPCRSKVREIDRTSPARNRHLRRKSRRRPFQCGHDVDCRSFPTTQDLDKVLDDPVITAIVAGLFRRLWWTTPKVREILIVIGDRLPLQFAFPVLIAQPDHSRFSHYRGRFVAPARPLERVARHVVRSV